MKITMHTQSTIKYLILLLLWVNLFPLGVYGIDTFTSHPVYQGMEQGPIHYDNIQFRDIQGHWAEEVIQQMSALSIVRGMEGKSFQPNGILTHLQALTLLVRGIGQEEEAQRLGEAQLPLQGSTSMGVVEAWGRGYVLLALERGIITPEEMIEENLWNRPISRQQVALWVGKALGIEPIYGEKMVQVYAFSDWQAMDTEKIPFIEALLQKGWMSGLPGGTFVPQGQLTRGQMAQIMANLHDDLLEMRGLKKKIGHIYALEKVTQQGVTKRVLTLENDDNSKNHLVVTPSYNQDFIVQKEKRLGLSEELKVGDTLEYYINEKNEIIYGKVLPTGHSAIEGIIEFIDPENHRLIVIDFEDKRHLLQGQSFTSIEVNGQKAGFKDLFYGQEVRASLLGGKVVSIKGLIEEDPHLHGYIPPGSRVRVGNILSINQRQLELAQGQERESFSITSTTRVVRGDGTAQLFEIKPGDRVMLHFDDIYTNEIAMIRVEDGEKHIQAIYRGTLEQINEGNKEILLKDIIQYDAGRWQAPKDQRIKLRVETDQLYEGPSKIPLRDLNNKRNQEVYVAVESSFGIHRVAKLLVKEGSTLLYEDKVGDIKFGIGQLIVSNQAFSFHRGTIVVKNNRLIDLVNLDVNQSIYMVADFKNGSRNAAFLAIEGGVPVDPRLDGSRLVIYKGSIQSIKDYGVTIGRLGFQLDYLQLRDHQWQTIEGSRSLALTEETYIFDSQLQQEVPTGALLSSRFINPRDIKDPAIRDRVEKNYYINKTAYFVVRETTLNGITHEEVISINLAPHRIYHRGTVHTDHVATGTMETLDQGDLTLTLINLKNWNTLNGRWESVANLDPIDLQRAVVLLNDRPLAQEQLHQIKKGARVYVLKEKQVSTGDEAYILIVEQ